MTTAVAPAHPLSSQVKVNVRLCGSIPRQDMELMKQRQRQQQFLHEQNRPSNEIHSQYMSSTASLNASHVHDSLSLLSTALHQRCAEDEDTRLGLGPASITSSATATIAPRKPPTFEAPSWAVPAHGETRLEPIGDCSDLQAPIDLKSQAVFRVGRSPQSDVQLLHATSSRRHAMLFHHSNGSCYLIDCGSAHGTYINGARVESTPTNGVVIPHKVRRGSLIRFGGPGAPEFMLKSFSFELNDMMNDDVPMCIMPVSTPVMSAVVEHNTRLNALGKTAKESLLLQQQLLSSKRSFDSMETMPLVDEDMSSRCSSPPLSPEQSMIRLVSPDSDSQQPSSKRRRVTFSQEPPDACYPSLVSPDLSSDEQEEDGNLMRD
mmetsp:Transcript_51772/g.124972  ORF Transcript_51772/g.124972 Transcript_51772/m.124972 type:complete len:376 (-) Transcript_51772:470-1597(-)|eukprot:CAMPEP_0113457176 /NCGR_PEP_ID=MMETSP0014_2-20120614/9271_1 /TAXON_ID=2857 /ORGANISM="Nitzschia sp." /LENGTH=375 /DNA_ID=CAMNT_0000348659 /DNA_START=556 /DNA_END=1683 /DNA_ORIENTATION=+ /assembly_acc=CAM_ASM_000159